MRASLARHPRSAGTSCSPLRSANTRSSFPRPAAGTPRPPRNLRCATTASAKNHDVDVAIFGGGPAGLSTARAIEIASPGTRVAVFERARSLKPVGFTIGLMGTYLILDFIFLNIPQTKRGDVALLVKRQASYTIFFLSLSLNLEKQQQR